MQKHSVTLSDIVIYKQKQITGAILYKPENEATVKNGRNTHRSVNEEV